MVLDDLPTPSLVLDLDRLERNCDRMIRRAAELGVRLRPHMKTAKSVDVGRLATREGSAGVTVSTLAEAAHFAEAGFGDITYAVGIAGHKVGPLAELQRRTGARISLLADTVAAVEDVARHAEAVGERFALMIEIDCGGGRGGVSADGAELPAIGAAVRASAWLSLAGVLTHAGQSYGATSVEAIRRIAEEERVAVTRAADRLRAAGIEVPVVSVGSTPTALHARSLPGVTEMRPGVYTLFDLAQVALGSCTVDDIAVSVLTTVIGHNPRAGRMLIDAGALALSKDVSGNKGGRTVGYGLVCPATGGRPADGLVVADVHQEHGLVACEGAAEGLEARYPVGTRVRILPNHACLMAAPYDRYHLVRGTDARVEGVWAKITGW
ncbi:MAG TPA: alanine racemase [Gemmatimonadales bacterium]|nr:alanine racemase [Gemmatimonadales bacterium]